MIKIITEINLKYHVLISVYPISEKDYKKVNSYCSWMCEGKIFQHERDKISGRKSKEVFKEIEKNEGCDELY